MNSVKESKSTKAIIEMPLKFTLDPKKQPREKFIEYTRKGITFHVSSFGRVRRGRHLRANKRNAIIKPYLVHGKGDWYVRLQGGDCIKLKKLVYTVFTGLEIEKGMDVFYTDGNSRNLNIKNLYLGKVKRSSRYNYKPVEAVAAAPVKVTKVVFKLKEIEIDINKGNKAAKLAELNGLKKQGYYLKSETNGVYAFRLAPKEGDFVKIVIEGSVITGRNRYEVKCKDGLKYYLKGVDPVNFFFADELEII